MQSWYRIPSPTPTHTRTRTHRVFLLSISPVLSFLCNASSWLSPISPTKINHYKFRIISSFVLISQPHFVLLAWLYSPSPLPLWTSPSGPVTFTSAFTFFTVPTHHQSFLFMPRLWLTRHYVCEVYVLPWLLSGIFCAICHPSASRWTCREQEAV